MATDQAVFAAEPVPEASSIKIQGYVACGCGCCPGLQPNNRRLYKNKGDYLEKVIEEDKKLAWNTELCTTVGCSFLEHYQ
jgi:hypothetical protein